MPRPKFRWMQRNKGTEAPTSLLFFDTETFHEPIPGNVDGERNRLRLWAASHVRREGETWTRGHDYRGRTAKEFWDMLESLLDWRRPLWAFAHNLGFDITMLDFWSHLESKRFTVGPVKRGLSKKTGLPLADWRGMAVFENRPQFAILRNSKGTLRLIDTGNYYPTALAKIGEAHGLPKLKMPAWDAPDPDWFVYCERDVAVCRVAMTSLISKWIETGCGVFKMTAPALAMTNFQHTCRMLTDDGKKVSILYEDNSPARAVERGSYYGGRIEPFFVGKHDGPVYSLDCNSLYLSVMRDRLYPRKRGRRVDGIVPDRLLRMLGPWGAIADVHVRAIRGERTYPIKANGVQCHATGSFWTTLAGPELQRALLNGDVDKVGECWLYSVARIFAGWADYWFDRKQAAKRDGDAGEHEFAKLIGTSLSGKFGQRGDWWIDAPWRARRRGWGLTHGFHPKTKVRVQYRLLGGHWQMKVKGEEPPTAFPAIASYVTSYAREYMAGVFRALPERSLLYTATDSLLVTQAGYDALDELGYLGEEEMGKFRLEGVYPDVEICGPNWYRKGDKWTCAGLHGSAHHEAGFGAVAEVWDSLAERLTRKPDPYWDIKRIQLDKLVAGEKNSPTPDGWRRPYRFGPDDEWSDKVPRLIDPLAGREYHSSAWGKASADT